MRLVSSHELHLSAEDLKTAIYRHLKESSLDLDLPTNTKDLIIGSNVPVEPCVKISWVKARDDAD